MNARKRHRVQNVVALLLFPLIAIVLLRWFEHKQVYHPGSEHWESADALGRPWRDVSLVSSDGVALHGWFFPAHTDSARQDVAILHCHGNAGNISHRLDIAELLLRTGANVLLFDYRGYGKSAGRPSERGTYLDAEAAHDWLSEQGFSAGTIIAYGESLGGGVATELALRRSLGGLVLQSTFTSIPDVGAELFPFLPVRMLARIQYDTVRKLAQVRVPVLVMHSRLDTLVPFSHAERNFAAAKEPKKLWEIGGDHNDFLEASGEQLSEGMEWLLAAMRRRK